MRAITEAAASGSSVAGGSSTGTPPARTIASAYITGSRSAGWSHTPHFARSRYVVSPISGRIAHSGVT